MLLNVLEHLFLCVWGNGSGSVFCKSHYCRTFPAYRTGILNKTCIQMLELIDNCTLGSVSVDLPCLVLVARFLCSVSVQYCDNFLFYFVFSTSCHGVCFCLDFDWSPEPPFAYNKEQNLSPELCVWDFTSTCGSDVSATSSSISSITEHGRLSSQSLQKRLCSMHAYKTAKHQLISF